MRNRFKRLSGPAIAIVVLTLTMNIIIDNPYTHSLFRTAINVKLAKSTNIILDFEALSLSIVPLGVDMYGVNIQLAGPDQRFAFAKSSHLLARISPWSIVMGNPRLSLVKAVDLEVIWPPPWNMPKLLKDIVSEKSESTSGAIVWPPEFIMPVQSVALSNARIFFESTTTSQIPMRSDIFYAALSGLDVDIDINDWDDIDVNTHVESVDLANNSAYLLESSKLDFSGNLSKNIFSTDKLSIKGERIDLSGRLKGTIDTEPKGHAIKAISLFSEIESKFDFSILGSILDLPETRGPVDSRLRVTANFPFSDREGSEFKVEGDAKFRDAYLSGFKLFDSSADFVINKDELLLKHINLLIENQSYGLFDGSIKFNEAVDYEFTGIPTGLHLIDLLSALKVDFDDFDFGLFSNNFSLKGQGAPFSMDIAATAELSKLRVAAVESLRSDFPNPPNCRSDLKININEKRLNLALPKSLCFQPSEAYVPSVTVSNQLPKGAMYPSTLNIAGEIRFDTTGLDLNVTGTDVDVGLGKYYATIPLAGTANIRTRIYGPYTKILVENKVTAADLQVNDIFIGTVAGQAVVDTTLVKWTNVKVNFAGSGILESPLGSFSADSMNIMAKINGSNIQHDSISKLMAGIIPDYPLSFDLRDFHANLQGPVLMPGKLLGQISGNINQLVFDSEKLFDSLNFSILSNEKGWSSQQLTGFKESLGVGISFNHRRSAVERKGAAAASSSSWRKIGLNASDQVSGSIDVHRVKKSNKKAQAASDSENHLQALPFAGDALKPLALSGLIEAKAKFDGNLGKIQGTVAGKVEKLSMFGSPLAPVRFQGFLTGSILDLTFEHSGDALKGRLSMDILGKGVPYEWYLSLKHFDLRALGTKVFFTDPRNYIYATADWKMKGHFTDWWNSTGELSIDDLLVKYLHEHSLSSNSLLMELKEPVKIAMKENSWQLQGLEPITLNNDLLNIRISTPNNSPPKSLGILVNGTIKAEMAKLFSDQVESTSGNIAFSFGISGSVTDPKLTAHIENLPKRADDVSWQPLSIGIADIRPAFQNINLDIDINNGIAVIKTFTAEKGSGKVALLGAVDLAEDTETGVNLQVFLDNAAVTYPVPMIKSFDTVLDGQVVISGTSAPFKVGGDITIVKARSTRPFDIRTEIVNALKKKSLSSDVHSTSPTVLFGLAIKSDRSIIIKNRNIDVLLSSDLRLGGTDIAPEVSGQTVIEQGKFVYKQNFVVNRGIVTFDDPVRLDPSLDIAAVSDVPPYKIFINISGKASDPIVGLSVEPPTREDGSPITSVDILILLSRGSLPKGKTISESSGTATTEVVNLLAGQIEQPLEKLFDLSGQTFVKQFYIDSYASEKDGAPVLRVNVPINLAKDLDVIVSRDRDTAGVSLEYPLHESISISGKSTLLLNPDENAANYESDTGVGLKFRFAFP